MASAWRDRPACASHINGKVGRPGGGDFPDGVPELPESKGFDRRHLGRARDALVPHVTELCDRWRTIHGDY